MNKTKSKKFLTGYPADRPRNAEKERNDGAEREKKRVWRGICVLEEIRVVPLADGRREGCVFVLRDDVASVTPEKRTVRRRWWSKAKEAKMTIETKGPVAERVSVGGGWVAFTGEGPTAQSTASVKWFFQLTGEGVDDLARRFVSGQAVCNVTKLKAQVEPLKRRDLRGRSFWYRRGGLRSFERR
jgi:hypothetical protein